MTTRILTALPVYNEERHLLETLEAVRQYADEILVVDDGSSDGTPELLASQNDIRSMRHPQNLGYGAALRTAFEAAIDGGYDVLVTIDCDGQHEPRLIPELVRQLIETGADIVSGSRYLEIFEGDSVPPEQRRQINVAITEQLNTIFDLNLTDAFCGFKAYRVDRLGDFDITELGYAMPLQLWVQAVCQSLRIVEHPVPLIYLDEERSFGGALDVASERMAYYQQVLTREREKLADCLTGVTEDCSGC